jgi:hypothetical protein
MGCEFRRIAWRNASQLGCQGLSLVVAAIPYALQQTRLGEITRHWRTHGTEAEKTGFHKV